MSFYVVWLMNTVNVVKYLCSLYNLIFIVMVIRSTVFNLKSLRTDVDLFERILL